nr:alpha-L-rhamnosidase [Phocaeicola paurosaccharolyticus]
MDDNSSTFNGSYWIGAITRKEAKLPEGRNYFDAELKKQEVKDAWNAVPEISKRSIYLRKKFNVKSNLKKATAYICGLGLYEFTLNGKKVGDMEFAPLWSDYDKSVFYNVFDVTKLLAKRGNAVGVMLGNGFYNVNGGRYRKLQISFGPPTLRFVLMLEYKDGTTDKVVSDGSWRYDVSPVLFNCIYGGEDYDARLEQDGWDIENFNAAGWKEVVIQEGPKGVMRQQIAEPVKIMEYYSPVKSKRLSQEEIASASKKTKREIGSVAYVLDMAQNLSGFPEIKVKGRRGQTVTLIPGESLTEEGAVNQRETGRQHFYTYTLKGDGEEIWHPRFSYYGFRYIQIEGAYLSEYSTKSEIASGSLPVIKSVRSCFIYNSAKKVSTFECSNEIFNSAHRIIEKAARSNMQSVFTDCPHREKLGWLEEVHLNGPGLLYNYDLRNYGKQIMQNMADAQRENGSMPTTAPEYVVFKGKWLEDFAESPEWGASLVVFPFMYRDFYQDDSLIRKYYHNMSAYMEYLSTRAENGILSFGLGDWYDFGDYRAGFSRNTPVPLVATAHYYMMLDYICQAAQIVGAEGDAEKYRQLAENVKIAFNEKFYNKETHQYGTGSQCSNALPLFLNMEPEGERSYILSNLVNDIKAHGVRLTTGDVGNRYLFQTLARNGLNELMYEMHNHYDSPGYGFQLKFGATTLTEQWDPRKGASWNHFMMGQIDEWFFNSLAGINIDFSGKITISPNPVGDLKYVKASTLTNNGKVSVEWNRKGNKFSMKVVIPENSDAEIKLPEKVETIKVKGGVHKFNVNII